MDIVSLGMSCQSAHQLARFAVENPEIVTFKKGPFDWLICPADSSISLLDSKLDAPQLTELEIRRNHVFWPRHDLWFWHGYMKRKGDLRELALEETFEREAAKFANQRAQFLALDPTRTLFIISNTQNNLIGDVFDSNEIDRVTFDANRLLSLKASLTNLFRSPINLAAVSRKDRFTGDFPDGIDVQLLSSDDSEWKGDDAQWNAALREIINT